MKSTRWRILLVLLILAAFVGLITKGQHRAEPSYQGKPLEVWLREFDAGYGDWGKGRDAVRAMGPPTIPYLLGMLRARDNRAWIEFMTWVTRLHLANYKYVPARKLHGFAGGALHSLGPMASNAVPEMIQIFDENIADSSRENIALALRAIGPAGEPAIPRLVAAAGSPDVVLRINIMAALGGMHLDSGICVPALTNALIDRNPGVRCTAIESLAAFGTNAACAVPKLGSLLSDQNGDVRYQAKMALQKIDPSALPPE